MKLNSTSKLEATQIHFNFSIILVMTLPQNISNLYYTNTLMSYYSYFCLRQRYSWESRRTFTQIYQIKYYLAVLHLANRCP